MWLFNDHYMAAFIRSAQEAAAEPDLRQREMQMAALAASVVSRLATSESIDDGEEPQLTVMFVAQLITNARLAMQKWPGGPP